MLRSVLDLELTITESSNKRYSLVAQVLLS